MTKVKICGITNLEDALLSAKFGADALGFNFYEKSPRYILPENAREIIEQLPNEILKVGVFVNESLEKIVEVASIANLDALQLHGEETPEFAKELKLKTNLEIIKAFRVSPEFKPEDVLKYETDAILLDAYSPKEHGGTGETFDWEIAKKVQEVFPKMYLAGGLSANNISEAIEKVKPFAVDACSLVEKRKGVKDRARVESFISRAKSEITFLFPPNNALDLLSMIGARPQIFTGKSISNLNWFFAGYQRALLFHQTDFWMGDFGKLILWIGEKYSWEGKDYYKPFSMILEHCNNNEEKAFDLFFALLEEFKLEKEDLSNE